MTSFLLISLKCESGLKLRHPNQPLPMSSPMSSLLRGINMAVMSWRRDGSSKRPSNSAMKGPQSEREKASGPCKHARPNLHPVSWKQWLEAGQMILAHWLASGSDPFGQNMTQSARTKSDAGWFCTILSRMSVEE